MTNADSTTGAVNSETEATANNNASIPNSIATTHYVSTPVSTKLVRTIADSSTKSPSKKLSSKSFNKRNTLVWSLFVAAVSFYTTFHLQFDYLNQFSATVRTHHEQQINVNSTQVKSAPILYSDATLESSKILLRAVQTLPPHNDDEIIDPSLELERCRRYNFPYSNRTTRRRIFYGSLIADDSWDVIATQAMETHDVFHTAVLVESNRTQMGVERGWRFSEQSEAWKILKEQKIFGKDTQIFVDYYINEPDGDGSSSMFKLKDLGRENHQRSLILNRWKENGMTPEDIGYISDVDEIFSRDFLRAVQICDVKEFDASPRGHGNCKHPRVSGWTLVFEGGPGCMTDRRWFHPDLMIGACIEGISNESHLHPTPFRTWDGTGWMMNEYTMRAKNPALPSNTTHFPLWNAGDYRMTSGGSFYALKQLSRPKQQQQPSNITDGSSIQYQPFQGYAGYHLHNFFPSIHSIRYKYLTYGHPDRNAMEKQLRTIHEDLESMVLCGLGKWKESLERHYPLVEGGVKLLKSLRIGGGANSGTEDGERFGAGGVLIPLAFEVPGYVEARMKDLKEMLESSIDDVRR